METVDDIVFVPGDGKGEGKNRTGDEYMISLYLNIQTSSVYLGEGDVPGDISR